MSTEKPSPEEQEVKRPRYWDKRVSAAYLRILGMTQEESALRVGRSKRTIQNWEADPSWPLARAEARERWFVEAEDASRRAVLDSVKAGNAALGLTLLERLDDRLAPPKQRVEASGPEGGPIEVDVVDTREKVRRRLTDVHNRIADFMPTTNGDHPGGNGAHG